MELVYLWVEDYKNIKKQGFNFSPNYECEFKANYKKYMDTDGKEKEKITDKSELKITPKENPLKDFFGKNLEINAFVGKNGSGKTSVLTLITGGLFSNHKNWRNIKNLILLYKNGDKLTTYSFSYSYKRDTLYEELNFNTNLVVTKKNLYKDFYLLNDDIKYNYHLFMDFTIGQIDFWNDSNQKDYKKFYSLEPSRNYFSKGPGSTSKIEPTSFAANMKANILYVYKNLDYSIIEKWKLPNFKKLVYYGIRRMGKPTRDYYKDEILGKKILGMDFTNSKEYEDVKEVIVNYFTTNKEINFDAISKSDLEIISILFLFADIEFEDNNEISFFSMSAGQKQLISYFGIIVRTIKENLTKNTTLTLIIDEIETSLHPQWQKEFLKLLLELFDSIKGDCKNIQLILAGHSPFIVSDLPRANIVFLKDCSQIKGIDKKETFGSNIHTLLSDSFFVEDGLMGEFAKDKISQILYFLSNKIGPINIPIKQIKPIIEIIGEDFLREKLLKMYDKKFPLSKEEKIKKLKEELESLEND